MSHARASPNAWDYSFEGQIPSSGLCVYTRTRMNYFQQPKEKTDCQAWCENYICSLSTWESEAGLHCLSPSYAT